MSQFEQLVMFYNQLLFLADEVKGLAVKKMYDEIIDKLPHHNRLNIQVKMLKKTLVLSQDELLQVTTLENAIKSKETENLNLIIADRNIVKSELDRLNKKSKIVKAYSQETLYQEQGSIIDVDDSYQG